MILLVNGVLIKLVINYVGLVKSYEEVLLNKIINKIKIKIQEKISITKVVYCYEQKVCCLGYLYN